MNWPGEPPRIDTERLHLRPFTLDDAPNVRRLVNTKDIAATVVSIPHPYPEDGAIEWIGTHEAAFADQKSLHFAMTARADGELLGCMGLHTKPEPCRGVAEIGYWVAVAHWGRGLATEAAAAVVRYGFETLDLHRIEAHHMTDNPASGRVMKNIGMRYEGTMRQRVTRFEQVHDLDHYAILRDEYDAANNQSTR